MAFKKLAELAQGQLIGRLKRPARRLHDFRDHQLAAVMIVPAQPVAHDFDRQRPDADAMAGTKMFAQGGEKIVPVKRQLGGKRLGGFFKFGKMVARLV